MDDTPTIGFFKLFQYASIKDKIFILIGVLCALATGLTAPANTFIFGDLADAMIAKGSGMVGDINEIPEDIDMEAYMNEIFLDEIASFAMYNCILGAIMLIGSYLSIMLFNYAALNQIFRIRSIFLKSVLNQDIGWFDANQSGEFASRMNEDLTKLEDGLGEKVAMFLHFIVAFIGSMILGFVKGWELALVCLSSLPVTLVSVITVSIITARLAKREMDEYAKAGSIAEEVFSAVRTVFAFGGQHKEVERYKENLISAKKISVKRSFFAGLGFGILWFCIYSAYALAFWYGVKLVLKERGNDEIHYTPGVMFTVFFSVMMGSMNLGMASPYIETFGIAKGAGAKVFKIIKQIPTINPLSEMGVKPDKALGNIRFQNIVFQYPSRQDVPVLQGLSFSVSRGQTVALVGSSGCGKSTCIQLIQRFYNPSEGQILLDDHDIKELNVNWLRSRIGVVGQEPVLFGVSVYENIRYGKEDATREEIESAARAANAHIFIKKLPNGYETLVGERGAQMSGGQKQRIAIARALVRNPEILLLDEATSALDTASEAKVQAALEQASKGRTTLIIAHRLSTVRNADKIVVLDKGCVVEQGSHDELMKLRGHYYGLVTTQVGDSEDGVSVQRQLSRTESLIKRTRDEDDDIENLIISPDVDLEEEAPTVPVMKIMLLNKPEWFHILVGSISSIITGFAMPIFAVLFGDILGVMSDPDPDYVRSEANKFSLYFVIAGVTVGLATFLQMYTFGVAGELLTERLRGMAFGAMVKQEIAWFDNKSNGTGTLCARLSNDAAAVQGATGQRIGNILQSLATIGLGVGLSMYYEWRLGLVAMAFVPFILVATYMQQKVLVVENRTTRTAMEGSTKLAVEVVSSIRTVVSLGREKMFHEKYMELLVPSTQKAKFNTHYRGFVYGMARSLMFFAFAVCMWYGGYLVANDGLYYANVFKVSQALIMGTVSIANALAFTPNFQKGLEAAAKIFQLLEREPRVKEPENPDKKLEDWQAEGNVHFKDVDFKYPTRPDARVLDQISLDVNKGQTVALVGSSGCGKSTCIQLIERFYDADKGLVSVDDKNVQSVTLNQLRSQLGIVSQEPSLFDRTIAENIAYGDNKRNVSLDEVIEAAKKANIHNFVASLPLGYETRLGEKGTQLSGGQKQRIAIARALVRNPRVLLLDEATSALDSESEKVVQDALDQAKEGRTCITIAHRLSTIVDSDVILVINAGQVVEQGTHKELLALKGIYYGLYKLQSGAR